LETRDGRGKGTRDRGTRRRCRRCRRGCQIKRAAGMTQGGVRASWDDEREGARHHRKQAASPARLKTDKPPLPACRCLAPRVNGASSPVCVRAKRREKSVLPQSLRAPCWAWDRRGLEMATSGSAARNDQAGGGMTLAAAIPTLLRPVWRCRCLPWSRAVQGLCRGGRAMRCWVLGAGCWLSVLAIGAAACPNPSSRVGLVVVDVVGGVLVRLAVLSPACPSSSLLGRARVGVGVCVCVCRVGRLTRSRAAKSGVGVDAEEQVLIMWSRRNRSQG
jgi:hypothetical protein